jgi:hypothetical protein
MTRSDLTRRPLHNDAHIDPDFTLVNTVSGDAVDFQVIGGAVVVRSWWLWNRGGNSGIQDHTIEGARELWGRLVSAGYRRHNF